MTNERSPSKQVVAPEPELTPSDEDTLDAYLSVLERIHRYISADPERLARFHEALTDSDRPVR